MPKKTKRQKHTNQLSRKRGRFISQRELKNTTINFQKTTNVQETTTTTANTQNTTTITTINTQATIESVFEEWEEEELQEFEEIGKKLVNEVLQWHERAGSYLRP